MKRARFPRLTLSQRLLLVDIGVDGPMYLKRSEGRTGSALFRKQMIRLASEGPSGWELSDLGRKWFKGLGK